MSCGASCILAPVAMSQDASIKLTPRQYAAKLFPCAYCRICAFETRAQHIRPANLCQGSLGFSPKLKPGFECPKELEIESIQLEIVMRAALQRVTKGRVTIEGRVTGEIGYGLVILLGVGAGDTEAEVDLMANKVANLRIFADGEGKFNLSAVDVRAEMLVVSQFTLYADCRKGRRPSFTDAARPEIASPLCDSFVEKLRAMGFKVETGEFQAEMLVEIHNAGPVTIWLDTADLSRSK